MTKRIKSLEEIIQANNTLYQQGKSGTISDVAYDNLREELRRLDPKNKILLQVGDKVDEKGKVKLPFTLGSLVDMKPGTGKVKKWVDSLPKNTNFIGSLKLDGASTELIYENGDLIKAYSRGDGFEGQDITNKVRRIKNVPLILSKYVTKYLAVRGECILEDKIFQENFSDEYENARNAVAGVINSQKSVNFKLLDKIDFIAYERLDVREVDKLQQLLWLADEGFKVVPFFPVEMKNMNDKYLEEVYLAWKKDSYYFIDGIVIDVDQGDFRKKLGYETNSLDPKYARAFKTLGEVKEATISKIEWRVSKHGVVVPRVHIKPIRLGGVTITHTSGFNAGYINDNGVGIGTKIKIVRSGEVIPHVLSVIKKVKPILPKKCPNCTYPLKWDETKVNLMCYNKGCSARMKKRATFFIQKIGVKKVSDGIIKKLSEYGYDTINSILKMTIEDLMKIDGIQKKTAETIYNGIRDALNGISLPILMHASGFFGPELGSRKLALLEKEFGERLLTDLISPTDIKNIKGFEEKSAMAFATGIIPFRKWFKNHKDIITLKKTVVPKGRKLIGMSFVFTGIRDKNLEENIQANGGEVKSSVNKDITILICKQIGSGSSKENKAQELGVKIMDINAFKKWWTKNNKE